MPSRALEEPMPELPEVEVITRGIEPRLRGRMIVAASHSGLAMRHLPAPGEIAALKGRTITGVRRRAKYIVCDLDCGLHLVLHLGMTGRLGILDPKTPVAPHDHLRLLLDNDRELRLNDSRRFGGIWIADPDELARLFAPLGPEPLTDDFSAAYMEATARGRRRAIKNMLMDNRVVVGIGNIYASEALFSAAIHPARPAAEISGKQWRKLVAACKDALQAGIDCGGTTISDYRNSDGMPGYFQNKLKIYGRKKCPGCGGGVERTVLAGRASFFCRRCQK